MPVYATSDDLAAYVADTVGELPDDADAVERILERAEVRLDAYLGPYTIVEATGRKVDPAALTASQRTALSRATCACAEWELLVGDEVVAGGADYSVPPVVLASPPSAEPQKALLELAGHGLLKRSGVALPTPAPAAPSYPWGCWPWDW